MINDRLTGEHLRDVGMARAHRAANPEWKARMYECIAMIAKSKPFFTSDDVEELRASRGFPTTHENRAFGPLMLQAQREGICRPTRRFEQGRRKSLHARPLRVWQSLIWVEAT